MKSLAKQLAVLAVVGVMCFSTTQAQPHASVQSTVSDTQVYVCTEDGTYRCDGTYHHGPIDYESDYIRHVLANEWPGQADDQALKAGAIAIRTFGWRYPLGCGAGTAQLSSAPINR